MLPPDEMTGRSQLGTAKGGAESTAFGIGSSGM
jgi:hypothetical protein